MLNRILVPLDGSRLAEGALHPAVQLAGKGDGEVFLIRVPVPLPLVIPDRGFVGPEMRWPDEAMEKGHEEAAEYLRAIREKYADEGVPVRAELIGGDPASVIVGVAEQQNIDLIAMCTHGRSGVNRWILGSVTEKVLRSAPCPVLVVRTPGPFERVLVPLDGSRLSERALAPALAVAARMGSAVTLLHSTETLGIEEAAYWQLEAFAGRDIKRAYIDKTRAYLERVAEHHARPGLTINVVQRNDPPADAIVDFATTQEIDLIAMATHGRTGLRHWVYGSVTEKVLRSGGPSMLIVPSYEPPRPERIKLAQEEIQEPSSV